MTDTTFKSSFPHSHPSFPRRRESIFGHCRRPSELGGTNADFHPSVCRRNKAAWMIPLKITPVQSPLRPFSCLVVSVATDMGDCYDNRRQPPPFRHSCGGRNPVPGALPTMTTHPNFHPLMWPSQGHGDSEERSDEESTISPPPGERYREGVFAIQLAETEQLPSKEHT